MHCALQLRGLCAQRMNEGEMQTPSEKDLQLALIEELKPPEGPPQALGPSQVNPWSERAKDEALLKAMRPSTLPDHQAGDAQVVAPGRSQRGAGERVVEENTRLWHYIDQMQKAKDRAYQQMQANFGEKMVGAAMRGPVAAGPAWDRQWRLVAMGIAPGRTALLAWGGGGSWSADGQGFGSARAHHPSWQSTQP